MVAGWAVIGPGQRERKALQPPRVGWLWSLSTLLCKKDEVPSKYLQNLSTDWVTSEESLSKDLSSSRTFPRHNFSASNLLTLFLCCIVNQRTTLNHFFHLGLLWWVYAVPLYLTGQLSAAWFGRRFIDLIGFVSNWLPIKLKNRVSQHLAAFLWSSSSTNVLCFLVWAS